MHWIGTVSQKPGVFDSAPYRVALVEVSVDSHSCAAADRRSFRKYRIFLGFLESGPYISSLEEVSPDSVGV